MTGILASGTVSAGRNLLLDFGTITNTDTNESTQETIILTYTTVVRNQAAVDQGVRLRNRVDLEWVFGTSTQRLRRRAQRVRVLEPELSLTKTAPTFSTNDRTITYQIAIAHTTGSDAHAYDVVVNDNLFGLDMDYISGTLQVVSGLTPDTINT